MVSRHPVVVGLRYLHATNTVRTLHHSGVDVVSWRDGGDSSAGNVTEVSQPLIPDHRDSTQFVLLRGRHLKAGRLGALGRVGRATGPGGERVGCDPRARVVATTCA